MRRNEGNGDELELLKAHVERLQRAHRETVEHMQRLHEQLSEDKLLADREVTRLRREAAALRRELAAAAGQDPRASTIRKLLEHWRKVNGRSERTNIDQGGDRWARVAKALRRYQPREVADAISGMHEPEHQWWVVNGRTDVKYVLDDQERFERFRDSGYRKRTGIVEATPQPPAPEVAEFAAPQPIAQTPISAVLALAHQGVGDRQPRPVKPGKDGDSWTAQCPACGKGLLILRGESGRVLVHCMAVCPLEAVLEAWGVDWPVLWRGAEHDRDAAHYAPVSRVQQAKDLAGMLQAGVNGETGRLIERTLRDWLPPAPAKSGRVG